MQESSSDHSKVDAFVRRWTRTRGGAERANYALFLVELCDLIGAPRPDPAGEDTEQNDYVFERAVRFRHDDGSTSPGRIDLYKKGCFVLEAKQSKKREKGGEVYEQLAFVLEKGHGGGTATSERVRSNSKSSSRLSTWDALMRSARRQAENYARALDEWPPFLIVVDVGNVIELYADFSRQGKNYAQFPDRNAFRISLNDLHSEHVRDRLRLVWEEPFSLDPAKHAAEVTEEIAALLAKMAQTLERRVPADDPATKADWAFNVSKFLMRCIFAMFAEGIGLLPKNAFLKLIQQHKGKANRFHVAVGDFFAAMDEGGYSVAIQEDIKRFNGGLFHGEISIEISEDELTLLEKAAARDWHAVEPAIFGTLLEQALSSRDRSKLGAHYTPRAYVARLVVPTLIEPLREDWDIVQTDAIGKLLDGDEKGAREAVKKFHDQLCDVRVLDPACGTGNFLYVSMELMKRLEGEVLDFLKDLGEGTEPLRTVDPHQFLGIELNPRAVPITELVLWIGYIQWWFRTRERKVITEPILKDFGTIKVGDAVLNYDKQELLKDDAGQPITRRDPDGVKFHPITGELEPDPDARLPVYKYINARPALWPEAEFVVGNPPFIAGKDMRDELGDGYTEAVWASRGKKSDSIDYVMYWWDYAASALGKKGGKLRRFGFITTNSITQKFSRRVLEKHLKSENPISLVFAVPDHPWQKAAKRAPGQKAFKKAAVRIAMTVAEKGEREGRLAEVIDEKNLDTDQPNITFQERVGRINPDISIGVDVTAAKPLRANDGISSPGVKLHGDGFILNAEQAAQIGLGRVAGIDQVIKPYLHNRDLKDRPRGVWVIDAYGLKESELRQRFPAIWQHLHETVKVLRQKQYDKSPTKDAKDYLDQWWIFGKPREELRQASDGLTRVIVTGETSKHRFFEFFPVNTIADNMIRVIASDDPYHLGVLSSWAHTLFSLRKGGWMGVGNDPRYQADCFFSFPFPDSPSETRAEIGSLAEELDALRKRVLAQHGFLTMTKLYNVCEKVRRGEALSDSDKAVHEAGCVGVIHELHEKIDRAVTAAYGWSSGLSDEDVLGKLVALNNLRREEEKRGLVQWLRPEYQLTWIKQATSRDEQIEADLDSPTAHEPELPKDDAVLVATLRQTLRRLGRPASSKEIALRFRDGSRAARRVERGLRLLAAAGVVRNTETGWFLPADHSAH